MPPASMRTRTSSGPSSGARRRLDAQILLGMDDDGAHGGSLGVRREPGSSAAERDAEAVPLLSNRLKDAYRNRSPGANPICRGPPATGGSAMSLSLFSLAGKVALVTGSGQGIGLAHRRGTVGGRRACRAERTRQGQARARPPRRSPAAGRKVSVAPFDVTDQAAVEAGVADDRGRGRADRHPDQQCRHAEARALHRVPGRGLARGDGDQPAFGVLRHAGGDAADAAAQARQGRSASAR